MLSRSTISKPQANDWSLFAPFGLKPRCYRFNKTWPVRARRTEGGSPLHDSWATQPPCLHVAMHGTANSFIVTVPARRESIYHGYTAFEWFQHCGFWFPFPPTCCHPYTSIFRLQHQLSYQTNPSLIQQDHHPSHLRLLSVSNLIRHMHHLRILYLHSCHLSAFVSSTAHHSKPLLVCWANRNSHTHSLDIS